MTPQRYLLKSAFALLGVLMLGDWALAQACSRTVQVPVAPTGFNVRVVGDKVDGVYPDLLRQLGLAKGCQFAFPVVPRARLSLMFFDSHEADLFLPASRNSERDQKAQFVPMLKLTPARITLRSQTAQIADVRGLLKALQRYYPPEVLLHDVKLR
jgi:polar amino acid transport system substrate-binding protein